MKILFLVNLMMTTTMMMKVIYLNMIVVHTIVIIISMGLLVVVRSSLFAVRKKYFSFGFQGRARGGRTNSNSMTNRLPPSTHFVRPQSEPSSSSSSSSYSRSKLYSVKTHRTNPIEPELQRSYSATLRQFYGTRSGQSLNSSSSSTYGNFRISTH